MDRAILHNVQTFIQLLQTAKGETVSKWNDEALNRALQWGIYCEKLYSKVCHKPDILEKLSRGLLRIQQQTGILSGRKGISAEDLKHSRQILLKILLENSSLSSELYHTILKSLDTTHSSANPIEGALTSDDFIQASEKCASLKSMCRILGTVDISLSEYDGNTTSSIDIVVDASILRNHLQQFSDHKIDIQSKNLGIESLLHSIATKKGGLEVIGMMLGMELECAEEKMTECDEFVFQWLMKNKDMYINKG